MRDHPVDDPVLAPLFRRHEVVALHVLRDPLERLAGVLISSRRRLTLITSRAWISMLVARPSKPPESWWIRIFAFGSAIRFPFVPPARSRAPIDTAIPTHVVWMSGLTYCIAS